jgi:hypothetical protein
MVTATRRRRQARGAHGWWAIRSSGCATPATPPAADTIAVALAAVRRLELRTYDGKRTGQLVTVSVLLAAVAAVTIGCAGGGCAQSFGGW